MRTTAALYLRYSGNVDNEDKNSIINQKEVLENYCTKNDISIFNIYIDIAKTGTNIYRKGFESMLKDSKKNLFDAIIVKDMSRFSRNYLDVARIIDELTDLNISIISLADNYDSSNPNDTMEFDIRNYLNTLYSNDLKRKIRLSIKHRATKKKITKIAKYGYKKNENGELEIDEEAAIVVRLIFDKALMGLTPKEIADFLIEQKIYCVSYYKYVVLKINVNQNKTKVIQNPYNWYGTIVSIILNDYEYCGHARNIVCKNAKNEEKNIILRDNHPAIISEEVFLKTPKRWDTSKVVRNNYLKSFFKCSKCNATLGYGERVKSNIEVYFCPSCKSKINKIALENIVFDSIKEIAYSISTKKTLFSNKNNTKLKQEHQINEKDSLLQDLSLLIKQKNENLINAIQYKEKYKELSLLIQQVDLNTVNNEIGDLKVKKFEDSFKKYIISLVEKTENNKYALMKELITFVEVTFNNDKINLNIKFKYKNNEN